MTIQNSETVNGIGLNSGNIKLMNKNILLESNLAHMTSGKSLELTVNTISS